jgi:hypothetical protein
MGGRKYNVSLNMNPVTVADFNQIPLKLVNDTPVLLGEVPPSG